MKKLIFSLFCVISLSSSAGFVVCELTNDNGNNYLSCTNKSVENLMKNKYQEARTEKLEIQKNANVIRPTIINKRTFLIKELLTYGFEMKTETIFTLNI